MLGHQEVALLGDVALVEEECYFVGFGVSNAHFFLLPKGPTVELSDPSPVPCLSVCNNASHYADKGLNL